MWQEKEEEEEDEAEEEPPAYTVWTEDEAAAPGAGQADLRGMFWPGLGPVRLGSPVNSKLVNKCQDWV